MNSEAVDTSRTQAARNRLWLNPVIGGFAMVAANFLFRRAVHQLYSGWFVTLVTIIGCILLLLGAVAVKRVGVLRAQIACYAIVTVGIAMAVASQLRWPF